MAQHTIGSRVLEWSMPGILRRIEVVGLGAGARAWGAAFVAGLHESHLEREGLGGLGLVELAERWPDHMAEAMGDRWSTPDYLAACTASFSLVAQRFGREMGADAVDEAEGNSQGDEDGPRVLDSAPETREAAGVS